MTTPRFLQIHTLHSYTAALLNRDDSGLAKRLTYGGTLRTRISSQCLKRHWRITDNDPHALKNLADFVDSFRSRELVTKKVIGPLKDRFSEEVISELEPAFQKAVYGEKADKDKKNRQTLLLGEPELDWLRQQAEELATQISSGGKTKEVIADWAKAFKDNIKAMRDATSLPGGLTAALFGRMVTSDPAANIEAPVHVAHAFTVHGEETEGDYFTAVDDLHEDNEDSGADTIQETELTCGLFYGYVVIDLPGLIKNCGGDADLASRVVHHLLYLIAEVSPGAKRGSTAPYGRADFMLVEAGDRQPRSLAGAWRTAVPANGVAALSALKTCLTNLDQAYNTGEARRYLSLITAEEAVPPGAERGSLSDLAAWAAERVKEAPHG